MRKHETAVCGTARTVVWEVGKCENRRQMPFVISIYLLPDFIVILKGDIKTIGRYINKKEHFYREMLFLYTLRDSNPRPTD